jgi:LPXTG-site transpeptidase (sortase) family protein
MAGQARPAPGEQQRRRATPPAPLPRRIAGSALLTLAVCMLGFAGWLALGSRLHYDRAQHDTYASFRVNLAQGTAPTGPTDPNNSQRLLALGTPVAVLSIPQIGLRAVVLQGTTGQVLENGPGHLRDTPLPGQPGVSVIYGRRAIYGGPFSRLPALSPGSPITVTTGQGVASYRILDIRRPGSPAPTPLTTGKGRLTLITADGAPFAPSGMLYVDADLTSKPQPAPSMVLSAGNLPLAENVMGTDPQAWVPLVLWGQLFLLAVGAVSLFRHRWGRWQAWLAGVPVLGFVGLSVIDEVTRLLPNLM